MKTAQEVRELFDKERIKNKDKTIHDCMGVSAARLREIWEQVRERMNNGSIVLEDIAWILNNPDFNDDEKLLLVMERGVKWGGAYCYEKSPKYIKLHSTIEGALNDPS